MTQSSSVLALILALSAVGCGARTPLGEPAQKTSESVAPLNDVVSVSIGDRHVCAVKGDGSVYCWGAGELGQLGDGKGTSSTRPVRVADIEGAVEVAAGGRHTCARLKDGTVKCWGSRNAGQTGDGGSLLGKSAGFNLTPLPAVGISDATAIGAGEAHTCVITGGAVQCFGANELGQLGNDAEERASAAVRVHGAGEAVSLAVGANHTCITDSTGAVRCWGSNEHGQMGAFDVPDTCTGFGCARHAVPVGGVTGVTSLASGRDQTCALAGSTLSCWGQLLLETTYSPLADDENPNAKSITIGRAHRCSWAADGEVFCMGDDSFGQLGSTTTMSCGVRASCSPTEVPVASLGQPTKAVVAGADTTCAILADGELRCWGRNDLGQLGDGTTTSGPTPKQPAF